MKFPHNAIEVKEVGDRFLVIYNWDELTEDSCPKIWENVELFDKQGKKIWTVNGMEKHRFWNNKVDLFVGTRVKCGRLQLTSYSGNSYDINLNTGEVTYFEFHK